MYQLITNDKNIVKKIEALVPNINTLKNYKLKILIFLFNF